MNSLDSHKSQLVCELINLNRIVCELIPRIYVDSSRLVCELIHRIRGDLNRIVCKWIHLIHVDLSRLVCESPITNKSLRKKKIIIYMNTRMILISDYWVFLLWFFFCFFTKWMIFLTSDCWSAEATVKAAFLHLRKLWTRLKIAILFFFPSLASQSAVRVRIGHCIILAVGAVWVTGTV